MAPPTIIAHKSTFLSTQTLHLSQSLTPSSAWRQANEAAEDGLTARAVDDALYRLNHTLSQHARRVYAPQASRHVAEQIEGLYHEAAARALRGEDHDDDDEDDDEDDEEAGEGGGERGEGGNLKNERRRLRLGTDFTTPEAISSLPRTWSTRNQRETTDHPLEATRYESLAETLKALSARRQALLARVERLRRVSALLGPFSSSGDRPGDETGLGDGEGDGGNGNGNGNGNGDGNGGNKNTVQENLVTRNGELERELERMRLLLARVAGRVAQLPVPDSRASAGTVPVPGSKGQEASTDSMDIDSLERSKVDALLDNL